MLTFTAGTQVWVSDPAQGWMQASVIRPEGDQLLVKTPNGAERTVAASSVHLQNTDKEWVEVRRALVSGRRLTACVARPPPASHHPVRAQGSIPANHEG